jgi:hypothetical protein
MFAGLLLLYGWEGILKVFRLGGSSPAPGLGVEARKVSARHRTKDTEWEGRGSGQAGHIEGWLGVEWGLGTLWSKEEWRTTGACDGESQLLVVSGR